MADNRLFLAFPADRLAVPLARLQDHLVLPGRRIPPEQLHLTLRFLGETTAAHQQALQRHLNRLALPAFALTLDRLGYFPRAGVVWIGPSRPPEALMGLADELELGCHALGTAPSHRAFRPHVTLFRHCNGTTLPAISPLTYVPERLALYRSTLTEQGPRYDCLQAWPLRE
ncbi:RNA 2',3'-cyclic phosphodiesterase [Zobellella endophytica]|uniref:RNA 2',3'-cyclic phosphodiesterase n=1 Tax=Zobellella endophytica TaxID=2116700 RepID=A0A2P7QWS3_9GAMM|nr:RNA 2',3'-cyclic phosphodiesterase [Zobellella endophytica]PSJ42409.1 RNA 2',3'-cyclic phosphodiesterase [Zobellella endophytica]